MNNRDITFVLKVQNDAKAGLQSLGVDFQRIVDQINAIGGRSGEAAKQGLEGVKAQATAMRQLIGLYKTAEQAQLALSRQETRAKADKRTAFASARTAEATSTTNITIQEERAKEARSARLAATRELRANARAAETVAGNRAGVSQQRLQAAESAREAAAYVSATRMRIAADAQRAAADREAIRLAELRSVAEERVRRAAEMTAAQDARSTASLLALNLREAENLRLMQQRGADRNRNMNAREIAQNQAQATKAAQSQRNAVDDAEYKARQRILKLEEMSLANEARSLKNRMLEIALEDRKTASLTGQAIAAERVAAAQARAQIAQTQALAAAQRAQQQQNGGGGNSRGGTGGGNGGFFGNLMRWGLGSPGSVGGNVGPGGRGGASGIFSGITGGAAAATSAVGTLQQAMRGLSAAYLVTEYIALADAMRQLNSRVGLVTDGTFQQSLVMKELIDTAQSARVGLTELGTIYYGLSRNNATLGLSQREMLRVTDTISKSIALSGVNAQAAGFGLMQLSQAFGTGQLRGEELNSVLEQLPGLAQLISKNIKLMNGTIGVASPGALKTLAEQGKLSIRQVIEAIQAGAAEIDLAFSALPVTVSQGMTVFKSGLMVFIDGFNRASGATEGLGKVLLNIGKGLSSREFIQFAVDVGDSVGKVANMIGSVLVPAFQLLMNVIPPLIKLLAVLGAAFAAMRVTVMVSFWVLGLATAIRKLWAALVVMWTTLVAAVALFRQMAPVIGITAAATQVLGASAVTAAGGVGILNTALSFLQKNPVIAALAAIAAAGVAIYTAMQMGRDGVENLDEAAAVLSSGKAYARGIDAGYITANADEIDVAISRVQQAQTRYTENAQTAAAASMQALDALSEAQARVAREGATLATGATGARGEQVVIKSGAQAALDAARAARTQSQADLAVARANVDEATRIIDGLNAKKQAALDTKPVRKGTDPDTKTINEIYSALNETSPLVGKVKQLQDIQLTFKQISENSIGSNFMIELTQLVTGIKDVAKLPKEVSEKLQKDTLRKIIDDWAANINDDEIKRTIRDLNTEISMLGQEQQAGGPLPIERKLFELRKKIAAERGKFVNPETDPETRAIAEQARGKLLEQQRLETSAEITKSYRGRLIQIEEESRLIGITGVELIKERLISDEIRKIRAADASITVEQARVLATQMLPTLQQIAQTEVSNKIRETLSNKAREVTLAVEEARAILNMKPIERDAGNDKLGIQVQLAKDLQISLADVQRMWDTGFQNLGVHAEQAAKDAKAVVDGMADRRGVDAMTDLTGSIADQVVALDNAFRSRLLVGDAAEREAFVQERINDLLAKRPELNPTDARGIVESQMGSYDAAKARNRAYREAPVTGTMEGVKKGYADFINQAADLTTMFAEQTRSALAGVQDAFVQLVTTGKGNFKAFAASIMRDIAAMIIKFLVLQAIMAAIGFFAGGSTTVPAGLGPTPYNGMGGVGFAAKGAAFDAAGSPQRIPAYASGGVFDGGIEVKKFARGGVVSSPTLFKMAKNATGVMGEAGPEAIMPLRRTRNGRLGIEVAGADRRRRNRDDSNLGGLLQTILSGIAGLAGMTRAVNAQQSSPAKVVVQQIQQVVSADSADKALPKPYAMGGVFERAASNAVREVSTRLVPFAKGGVLHAAPRATVAPAVQLAVKSAPLVSNVIPFARGGVVSVANNSSNRTTTSASSVADNSRQMATVLQFAKGGVFTMGGTHNSQVAETNNNRNLKVASNSSADNRSYIDSVTKYAKGGVVNIAATTAKILPFAKGGVLERVSDRERLVKETKQVQKYATGGVVSRPTFFPMANGATGLMGEAGAEAIMPLRRMANGRLGVESSGGANIVNTFAPSVQINVEAGKNSKPEDNKDLADKIGDQVGKIIDGKIAEFAQRESKPGGMFRRQGM